MKQKNSFTQRVLSLLLVFLMVVTLFPTSACAAESCTGDGHMESVYEIGNDTEIVEIATSGTVGESEVYWAFDAETGRLTISGNGGCDTFTSVDDQPWAHLRTEIREVWFNNMDVLSIESLAYWFDSCTALTTAEIPYTTPLIGENAFADCDALECLMIYYAGEGFTITPGAFATDDWSALEVALIAFSESTMQTIYTFDWASENRFTRFVDVYGLVHLETGYCPYCKDTYSYTLEYEYWSEFSHTLRFWCSNCGQDQSMGFSNENHTFNNSGTCTLCQYYDESKDNTICEHDSTSTTWSGCDWSEYCDNCDELIDYGTTHGTYTYGDWEYYTTSQHRRTYTCDDCGEGSYSYGYHSTTTEYSKYSATQHTEGSYCSGCESYIGSTTKESHSFTYGSWASYDDSQHRRTKTCSDCGYSTYEYADHSLTYGSYTSYNTTQHRRKVSCTCGYSTYEYVDHTITTGSWTSASDTQHSRTKSCSVCSYSTTETGSHSITNGTWASISATQHQRTNKCSSCNYSKTEKASHTISSTAWTSISSTQHQRTNSCATCSYSATEKASHSISSTAWKSISDMQHSRTNSCACGYSAVEVVSHTITHSAWVSISEKQHQRTNSCSCEYSVKETVAHADGNADDYCDSCNFLMTRFSVTVPANLSLMMASNGEISSATTAAIINNSTDAVEVTVITITAAGDWTLVPFNHNMAAAKVDSKLIGFSINGAVTARTGRSEQLSLYGDWTIAKGASLPLTYDAVASATSVAINNEQVLTLVFVIDWVDR